MQKNKLKSSKAIFKRFKKTSTGKYLRHKACRSHLLQKKSPCRRQKLRKTVKVKSADVSLLQSVLILFK